MKYGLKEFKIDFPNDDRCLDYVFDALHTRKCSCGGIYRRIDGRKQYYCSNCRFQIAPMSGTIFHKSDTPLTLWFHVIFIFCHAKSGISGKEIQRQLGVTYKCAYRILSLIRKAVKQSDNSLSGDVEVDSGYFGGKRYGGKNNEKMSEAMAHKSVVTVAAERGGLIRAKVVSDVSADALEDFIRENIKVGSRLYTDNAKGYRRLAHSYDLRPVDHSKGMYVKGDVHVNTVETFFSHLKRSIKGTFKSISRAKMGEYIDSFVWHYNNRHSDRDRFSALLGALLQPSM